MQDTAALQIPAMAAVCLSTCHWYIFITLSLVFELAISTPCFSVLFFGWLLYSISSML